MLRDQLVGLTMAQNDEPYLGLWVAHMLRMCKLPQNLHILDHGSVGDHAEKLLQYAASGVRVTKVSHPYSFDPAFIANTLHRYASGLQRQPHVLRVLYTAADELLFAVGAGVTTAAQSRELLRQLAASQESRCSVSAYELLPSPQPFRFELGCVLRQGNLTYQCNSYARRGMWWSLPEQSKLSVINRHNLVLLHLHKADVQTAADRHKERVLRHWRPRQRTRFGRYAHNAIIDVEQLQRWLKCDADCTNRYAAAGPIPLSWGDWL